MATVFIAPPQRKQTGFALLNLGFRPFFLGAAIFALLAMSAWMVGYARPLALPVESISAMQWHAHEMIYGYGLAVIAGFLLAAVKNWTGEQTLHGKWLGGLVAVWAVARLLLLCGTSYLLLAGLTDLLFGLLLMAAIAAPVVKTRQWKQITVLSKLVLIVAANSLFYLGALGYVANGVHLSLYGGLYVVVSLILVMGRRVIPFFIERGVDEQVTLRQYRWLDLSIMVLFIAFFINELFVHASIVTTASCAALFLLNGFRLYNWHTPGIWRAPLLWSLYTSSWLINLGFLLMALTFVFDIAPILTLHLFTIGGIGLMTVAMMGRVSLGHTGRNIKEPPPLLTYALLGLILSVVFRVFLPLLDMSRYDWWIGLSYLCWALAFILFLFIYAPILCKPRADGRPG